MSKPQLVLIESRRFAPQEIARFDPSELAPAECDQLARQPYIAQWMLDEGKAAFRDRRAARRWRAAIATVIAATFLGAAWALARAL